MRQQIFVLSLQIAILTTTAVAGADSSATGIVQGMMDAAGGSGAFERLGVLKIELSQEESTAEGTAVAKTYTAYVDSTNLDNLRMELLGDVVLACHNGAGWATQSGKLDDRPTSPQMAVGTLRQLLFPVLLPFSLEMDGVVLGEVREEEFEGDPVWRLQVSFKKDFFAAPLMSTTWSFLVRRSDHSLLVAEFLPPRQYRGVQKEGVRYRFLIRDKVEQVRLTTQLMMSGLDHSGYENAHVRITKLEPEVVGPYDPAYFLHPNALEALEESVPGFEDEP